MELNIANYIPEIIVGIVLGGFAWAFRNWADTIKDSSESIINKLEEVSKVVHDHRLETQGRITKVETEVEAITRQLDRCVKTKETVKNPPEEQ